MKSNSLLKMSDYYKTLAGLVHFEMHGIFMRATYNGYVICDHSESIDEFYHYIKQEYLRDGIDSGFPSEHDSSSIMALSEVLETIDNAK